MRDCAPALLNSPYIFSFSDDVVVPSGGKKAKILHKQSLASTYSRWSYSMVAAARMTAVFAWESQYS